MSSAEATPPVRMDSSSTELEGNLAFLDRYSRQIGAYGLEAMSKLLNMRILIAGLKGVGMETAKNLALAGPGAITLWDDTPAVMRDLGANFFLQEGDVGKPRAAAVAPRLQELNQMVQVLMQAKQGQQGELEAEIWDVEEVPDEAEGMGD